MAAWNTQWSMWDWATDKGRLEISKDQRQNFWIYGMINILREIGWRDHEEHMALRYKSGHEFQDRCKDIIECIRQYAEKDSGTNLNK